MASSYVRVKLNTKHWELASQRAKKTKIFENSYRKYEANEVGCLGEVVLEYFFKENNIEFIDERNKTTHDYLINHLHTLDVKTKDRTVFPKKNFDNSIPLYNHSHQRPDYYYFISLKRDSSNKSKNIERFSHACLLGFIGINSIQDYGKHWKKSQIDPSNGTKFWTDCMNIKMEKLYDNKKMIELFKI